MSWLWSFLLYNIPWWVWAWAGLLALGVLAMWVRNVGGLKNALLITSAVALAIGAGILSVRGRQQGAEDQQQKEQTNANSTLDKVHDARRDAAARDDDPDRLRDDDGFRRDD